MVTCKIDSVVNTKMNKPRKTSSSNSSGFRLLENDQLDAVSSISRNSIYKLKIDSMFDDTRSVLSQQLDDKRGSRRTRSIIMYGKHQLAAENLNKNSQESSCGIINTNSSINNNNNNNNIEEDSNNNDNGVIKSDNMTILNLSEEYNKMGNSSSVEEDVRRISNSVQAQIERMFTDVVKDANSCSFTVRCLGALPLKEKVTSLLGLQDPLRQLYLSGAGQGNHYCGNLDICPKGLRVQISAEKESFVTPFHNIAVWSAVKFVVSPSEGGAAFLPLITDPDNIDKSCLFRPLTAADQRRLSSGLHAPIFAVVMRSSGGPKLLECHGFVCQTSEDAIVIAATLYQSLMAHVNSTNSSNNSNKARRRPPRNQNGVSCISIASSSALTNSQYHRLNSMAAKRSASGSSSAAILTATLAAAVATNSNISGSRRSNSFRQIGGKLYGNKGIKTITTNSGGDTIQAVSSNVNTNVAPARPLRKKRLASSSLSGESDTAIREVIAETTTTEERKKKSYKTKRAPPIPTSNSGQKQSTSNNDKQNRAKNSSPSDSNVLGSFESETSSCNENVNENKNGCRTTQDIGRASNGDILTRVAIPRSGSFLNTGGLTRYKSRATRRHPGKTGGGGGSPLGFSELFNEFKVNENLHSLDDILNAIIDADGMSFNDLKPIYKEFLLKLAVTLTKDELYQRSKNIMRRQKKKKLKKGYNNSQRKSKSLICGTKGLKKVFWFSQFRSCKSSSKNTKRISTKSKQCNANHSSDICAKRNCGGANKINENNTSTGKPAALVKSNNNHRNRTGTSGSDVSEVRNENNTLNGINRNSSSGYVSCSECSYDSEACTCTSADRCYCSLGADHDRVNKKLIEGKRSKKKQELVASEEEQSSCKSEDKCYCSMGETIKSSTMTPVEDQKSETTWCDTDSCISTSKCYCDHIKMKKSSGKDKLGNELNYITTEKCKKASTQTGMTKSKHKNHHEKLALDYELFSLGKRRDEKGISKKNSKSHEGFINDIELNIRNLNESRKGKERNVFGKSEILADNNMSSFYKKTAGTKQSKQQIAVPRQKSSSVNDIFTKSNKTTTTVPGIDYNSKLSSNGGLRRNSIKDDGYYQSMRPVSASLEDSLGYLP